MAEFGDGSPSYRCKNCQNPIAYRTDLLSKKFLAKSGEAYMFSYARNIIAGQKRDKQLMTGLYTIADIYCSNCGEELGWKYLHAYDLKQKFKEGRFIIEKSKILKEY
ncbi:protein yippee-like [Senna tora]|uniref:Protein yippee-like n=1 Tax=Senna tora TaxID=362788 RepID=A0A834WR11_9FABA|nr:protein yippee-like [Senna tora]